MTGNPAEVTGYDWHDGQLRPVSSHWIDQGRNAYGIPSGGLVSTAADLQALANALLNGDLLPPRSRRLLTKGVPLLPDAKGDQTAYTYAGFIRSDANGTVVLHKTGGGTGVGSGAVLMLVPERKIAIILLRNLFGNGKSNGALASAVLNRCFGLAVDGSGDEDDSN